jgi:hypothetical protein
MMNEYKEQITQIIAFAQARGYNLADLNKPMLDSIMREWLKDGQRLYRQIREMETPAQKAIFGIK